MFEKNTHVALANQKHVDMKMLHSFAKCCLAISGLNAARLLPLITLTAGYITTKKTNIKNHPTTNKLNKRMHGQTSRIVD